MEFFELLFGLPELCGCLLQLFAAFMDVWAGVSTVRYVKTANSDESRPPFGRVIWVVFIALAATVWAVASIVRQSSRH